MASVAPVRKRHTFITAGAQDRLRFVPCHRQGIDASQLRRLGLTNRPPVHVQPKYLVEGRAHGHDVVVEAHAEDTRLLDFPLVADLARVLVLRELGEACQFLEGELLELGHGGVARRRRGSEQLGVCGLRSSTRLARCSPQFAGDLWNPKVTIGCTS